MFFRYTMKTALLICLLLVLASCARKLPVHEAGYGRIGVSYQVSNATSYQLIRAVELRSSRDEEFSVRITQPPLNGTVALSQPIAAGTYRVDGYQTRIVPVPGAQDLMRLQSEQLPDPVQINLGDGEIFLFPVGFTARQYNKAGYVFCPIGWQELDDQQVRAMGEELAGLENASMWTIRTK